MRVFSPRTLIPIVLVTCLRAVSQEPVVAHICVALMRSGTNTVSATDARDRLVKALNQRKPDKKLQISVAAVALADTWGTKAMEESKAKSCEFVLSTYLTELKTSSVLSAGTSGTDYVPSFSATLEYQLIRSSDGTVFATALVHGEDSSALEEALWQAVGKVAAKTLPDIGRNGNAPHSDGSSVQASSTQGSSIQASPTNEPQPLTPKQIEVTTFAADPCVWLPTNIPHATAVSGVCQYAMSLPVRMPNFICDQAASRFRGKNKVPFDLVTASVRYEDGNESYGDIKVNGQPKPEAITQGPGLWSTGEFGSNLRSIFDFQNHALFEFARESKWREHAAWVFTYTIVKQNDPLWRLHGGAEMLAPPYQGELWVDPKTGELLRFGSVATDIPASFPMTAAELQIDYANVAFADGSSFVLPADFTVTTSFRGQEATRNLVQFRSCHKFRAKTRMLLDVAAGNSAGDSSVDATNAAPSIEAKLDDDSKLYDILREQAVREDEARLERERNQELQGATVEAFRKLNIIERQRQKYLARQVASDESPLPLSSEKDALTTLKVSVKMVPVSVVLRDAKGNATGNLRKEDFLLFDNGKPQTITSFSIERAETAALADSPSGRYPASSDAKLAAPGNHPPVREVAYVFDDIHAAFGDLNQARVAALRHIAALRTDDRAALFTTSGEIETDFTGDREKLRQALTGLRQHPVLRGAVCPPVSEYMADLIVNHDDLEALGTATRDAVNCAGMDSSRRAEQLARSAALEMVSSASAANQNTLNVLQEVLRRTAALPGNRSIVLVSPGFLTLTPETRQLAMELVDRAVRANIVVHALDVRGLYVMNLAGNVSHPANPVLRAGIDRDEALAQSDVMAELAYGTGGTFFHNNNDVNEGFRRTADAPEYMYVLGFSPQKLDGKFHKLKVTLSAEGKSVAGKLTVQARQGYYAAKPTSGS